MLNEIFKGMDNAAEQINENFNNGSIVESGSNDNGEFVRYGNGIQICSGKFNHNFDVTKDKFPVFPVVFKDTNYYVSVSSGDTSWQSAEMAAFIGAGASTVSSPRVLGLPRAGNSYGERTYKYFAFGYWK